jgi:transposase
MLPPVNYDNLINIGVDEISFKKGRKYITIIYDLSDGKAKPIDYSEGNNRDSLEAFFRKLTEQQKSSIKTVNTDMAKAYIAAIQRQLPKADIIIDKYHLENLLNQAIDSLRKTIIGEMASKTNKQIMKTGGLRMPEKEIEKIQEQIGVLTRKERSKTRWVLLKRQTNHSEDQAGLLAKLEELNSPLYKAYLLKEQFYEIYQSGGNVYQSVQRIKNWVEEVKQTKLRALIDFCKTVDSNIDYVSNYFKYGRTSGAIEGVNNKIKVIKRMAYGYRDQEYFFRKIRSKYSNLPRLHLLFALP